MNSGTGFTIRKCIPEETLIFLELDQPNVLPRSRQHDLAMRSFIEAKSNQILDEITRREEEYLLSRVRPLWIQLRLWPLLKRLLRVELTKTVLETTKDPTNNNLIITISERMELNCKRGFKWLVLKPQPKEAARPIWSDENHLHLQTPEEIDQYVRTFRGNWT